MRFALLVLLHLPYFCVAQSRTDKNVVTLVFAGDVTLADALEARLGDSTIHVFDAWDVGEKDVFMVNLENPITTSNDIVDKEFNFKMRPNYVGALKRGGIDAVNCANNHTYDFGPAGLMETMRVLDSVGIPFVGVGSNLEDSRQPLIYEVMGMRIGFLGFHGRSAEWNATATKAGVAPRTDAVILADVAKLKRLVDFVVVNFHWGTELAEMPEEWQVLLAHQTIEAGADLIVGHHPHVLQGIEQYRGKVIAYSLGNFVFGGNTNSSYETAVLRMRVTKNEAKAELVPVQVEKYRPRVASGKTARAVIELVRQRSRFFKQTIPQLN